MRFHDKDWNAHRAFFGAVGQFLAPGGVIVLQENNRGSVAETFRPMIEASGLAIVFVHGGESERTPLSQMYYIGIMRRGDRAADWTVRLAR